MVMYDVWEYVTEEYGKDVRKLRKACKEGLLHWSYPSSDDTLTNVRLPIPAASSYST